MLTDLVTTLGLDKCTNQQCIIATKDMISDLNFVFSEILSFYIKENYAIILLNLAQSSNHYNHLLLKYGINMRQLRGQQSFIIIDVLSEIEKLTDTTVCDDVTNTMLGSLLLGRPGVNCLKELYACVKNSVELIKSVDPCKRYVIFMDEISVLLNLGASLNAIEPFVQYCRSLCADTASSPNILLLGSTFDEQDLQNAKLVKFLLHLSDIRVQVEGLKTGYSKEAHGKITLHIKKNLESDLSHQKLLFKVTEKGAKLLTLGL